MMKFIYLSLAFCTYAIVVNADCVPQEKNFYWKSPCDGQSFENRVLVTNLTAAQKSQLLDDLGGINLSNPISLTAKIVNQYGEVQNPLLDLSVKQYKRRLGSCQWVNLSGGDALNNRNACAFFKNCHLESDTDSLSLELDIKAMLGSFTSLITVGDYYGVTLTLKDGGTSIFCIYVQDKVIAV